MHGPTDSVDLGSFPGIWPRSNPNHRVNRPQSGSDLGNQLKLPMPYLWLTAHLVESVLPQAESSPIQIPTRCAIAPDRTGPCRTTIHKERRLGNKRPIE